MLSERERISMVICDRMKCYYTNMRKVGWFSLDLLALMLTRMDINIIPKY